MIDMFDDTMSYLLHFAKNHDIKVIQCYTDKFGEPLPPDMPSASNSRKRKVIMNMNWQTPEELPLILGHEIAHVLHEDNGICYFTMLFSILFERSATFKSITMLADYYFDQVDPDVMNVSNFMRFYCIPKEYYDYIIKYLKSKYRDDYNEYWS